MKIIKPIKPDEVSAKKSSAIPAGVIEAFNELITENWDGDSSRIKQDEAVKRIMKKLKLEKSETVFDNGYLDVEPIFENVGWTVVFDNENYEPKFIFSKK